MLFTRRYVNQLIFDKSILDFKVYLVLSVTKINLKIRHKRDNLDMKIGAKNS